MANDPLQERRVSDHLWKSIPQGADSMGTYHARPQEIDIKWEDAEMESKRISVDIGGTVPADVDMNEVTNQLRQGLSDLVPFEFTTMEDNTTDQQQMFKFGTFELNKALGLVDTYPGHRIRGIR